MPNPESISEPLLEDNSSYQEEIRIFFSTRKKTVAGSIKPCDPAKELARAKRILTGEESEWIQVRQDLDDSLSKWKKEWYLDYEGTIDDAIWQAVNSFDNTKGKFIAWCWVKGNDLFRAAYYKNKRHRRIAPTYSYDQLGDKDEEDGPVILDLLTPDGVDFDLACEHRLTVESIASRASKAGQMARMLYEGRSVAESGRKLGISETTAWDLVNELKLLFGAEIAHGAHGYKAGCRCEICKLAASNSGKSYYQRHKEEILAKQRVEYAKDPAKFMARTTKSAKTKNGKLSIKLGNIRRKQAKSQTIFSNAIINHGAEPLPGQF